ncbi:MAG: c-type cytochrome [Armatimonadota bacterium]
MRWWKLTAFAMSITFLYSWQVSPNQPDQIAEGRSLYLRHCSPCHGEGGKGDGPISKIVKPSVPDLTEGVFKFRSTPSGSLPTDEDLRRVILEGIPSTPMMGVKGILSDEEVKSLIAFLKTLCPDFKGGEGAAPIKINPIPVTPKLLELGKQIYREFQCNTCHGEKGDGDGPMAKSLKDKKGRPIQVLSFRNANNFKNGYEPADIYRTIMTGLDGTPMASFADVLTEEEGWAVAYFVHSLISKKPARQRSNFSIPVKAVQSSASMFSDDKTWEKISTFELPLQSLWRENKPESVRLKAAVSNQVLFLRLNWDDTTFNGKGKVLDSISVQIPLNLKGPVPSLFWGDHVSPVLVFQWVAGKGLTVFEARGFASKTVRKYEAEGQGVWWKGQWTVVLKLNFPILPNRLPFSVHLWDGGAGDSGEKRSITGWHWLEISPH